jgi:hypothetical protein
VGKKKKQLSRAVRAEVERIVQQGALGQSTIQQVAPSLGGVDPDDDQWRAVGNWKSRRDLVPVDQDRLIEIANYLANANPLAKRIRELRRDFVIGEGVTFEAEDSKIIQPIIDAFLADPVNNFDEYQFELVDYLGINGELFLPVFVNDFSGEIQLGWIDPVEVERVIADQRNRRIMRTAVMKFGGGPGAADFYDFSVKRSYSIVNIDTEPRSRSYGYRVGELMHFKVNAAPDARRGRSDFEATADFLDAWDQATFNDLERSALMLNFIWDVTFNGDDDAAIQRKLSTMGTPKPGSVRGHNENVTWAAVAPDLKLGETGKLADGIRQIILGASGLSDFYFGIADRTNRAGSDNLEIPILKGLTSRQRKVKAVFREIIDFAIDQTALKRPALKRMMESGIKAGTFSRKFDVKMPEISIKDLSQVGAVLTQVANGIAVAQERGWISGEMAAQMFQSFMSQFDFKYDPAEEMEKAQKEKEGAVLADYTPSKLGALTNGLKGLAPKMPADMVA